MTLKYKTQSFLNVIQIYIYYEKENEIYRTQNTSKV